MKEEPKLLPCPMCGAGNSLAEIFHDKQGMWRIHCGACGLTSGFRSDNNLDEIVEHWNTRPSEQCVIPEKPSFETIKGQYDSLSEERELIAVAATHLAGTGQREKCKAAKDVFHRLGISLGELRYRIKMDYDEDGRLKE